MGSIPDYHGHYGSGDLSHDMSSLSPHKYLDQGSRFQLGSQKSKEDRGILSARETHNIMEGYMANIYSIYRGWLCSSIEVGPLLVQPQMGFCEKSSKIDLNTKI